MKKKEEEVKKDNLYMLIIIKYILCNVYYVDIKKYIKINLFVMNYQTILCRCCLFILKEKKIFNIFKTEDLAKELMLCKEKLKVCNTSNNEIMNAKSESNVLRILENKLEGNGIVCLVIENEVKC